MKSVWVVEQGEYSDYSVVGVFSSMADAELCAKRAGGGASVDEWPLDPCVDELRAGKTLFSVHMGRDGETLWAEPSYLHHSISAGPAAKVITGWYRGESQRVYLDWQGWAKDKKHAVKIANEHRTRMIANGEWK